MSAPTPLDRVRELCLALPEANERLSHGSPTFFIRGKKTFVMFLDDHHGDGRLALWCAAPPGVQTALVEERAGPLLRAALRRPPRLGRRAPRPGLDWNEVAGTIEDAYRTVAPKRLAEEAIGERG